MDSLVIYQGIPCKLLVAEEVFPDSTTDYLAQ